MFRYFPPTAVRSLVNDCRTAKFETLQMGHNGNIKNFIYFKPFPNVREDMHCLSKKMITVKTGIKYFLLCKNFHLNVNRWIRYSTKPTNVS